ncbi:MAG: TIGR03663 family protein [Chloroflexota bacterium]|nr:TIGR03663 family protein [Chloroflexota bacterium]
MGQTSRVATASDRGGARSNAASIDPTPGGTSTFSIRDDGSASAPRYRLRVTVESALWVGLILTAALTRFWDLGRRALHHDESLHAYYSWAFMTGVDPYVHNPLMHGPFLFHANALVYALFGASDATSRYVPALFGTLLVGLPWLLRDRRLLGRWGALAAGAFFLISPAFLYYSRYIRHDLYTVVGTLLLFTALIRYRIEPRRRWLVTAAASLGFLFTNHEIVFAIALLFPAIWWVGLLRGRLRPLVPLHFGAAAAALMVLLLARAFARPLPEIPWDTRGGEAPRPTRENQLRYFWELLTHPLVLGLIAVAIGFVVLCYKVLERHRNREGDDRGWFVSMFGGAPDESFERATLNAWRDKAGLAIAAVLGLAIFVLLFSTFFTNLTGLATGTVATNGTLFYWLGQQAVQRGAQPWFYFLLEMPQYELIPFLLGGAASVITIARGTRAFRGGELGPAFVCQMALVVWFGFIFAALSYAGEKMPWLVVHISLPATLLAGSLAGELITFARTSHGLRGSLARSGTAWLAPALTVGLLVLAGSWFLLAGRLTWGEFRLPGGSEWQRVVTVNAQNRWWLLALPPIGAIGFILAVWNREGWRRTALATFTALLIGLSLFQVHMAWRMSYLEGDTARDMLIYNTTSPDVTTLMSDLGELSAQLTGGRGLEVAYDSCTSWPMQWYLRDYSSKRFFTSIGDGPNDAAVVIANESECSSLQSTMEGYTAQTYILRWHEPEYQLYRSFAIAPELDVGQSAWKDANAAHGPFAVLASVGKGLATQLTSEGQQRVYRIVMYRELPAGLNGYSFTVYIRNDLLPLYNEIRYGV